MLEDIGISGVIKDTPPEKWHFCDIPGNPSKLVQDIGLAAVKHLLAGFRPQDDLRVEMLNIVQTVIEVPQWNWIIHWHLPDPWTGGPKLFEC